MAQTTGIKPYRPGQGAYARSVAAVALGLVALFGCYRLFITLQPEEPATFDILGMGVPQAALIPAVAFIVLAFVVFLFTFGLQTGIQALDGKTHALIDVLIDTEAELAKVAWPGSNELTRSTIAVLVSIVLLGAFLFCVDQIVAYVMGALDVLPR